MLRYFTMQTLRLAPLKKYTKNLPINTTTRKTDKKTLKHNQHRTRPTNAHDPLDRRFASVERLRETLVQVEL